MVDAVNGQISLHVGSEQRWEGRCLPARVVELILGHICSMLEPTSATLSVIRNHHTLNVLLCAVDTAGEDSEIYIQNHNFEGHKLEKRSLATSIRDDASVFVVEEDVVAVVRVLLEIMRSENVDVTLVNSLSLYVSTLRNAHAIPSLAHHPAWHLLMYQIQQR